MSTTGQPHPAFALFSTGDVGLLGKFDEISHIRSPKLYDSPTCHTRISLSARAVPSTPLSPESNRSTSRRGAPNSLQSSRRSVSGMKKLLPLRLQSTLPTTSVTLWLNNTTQDPSMPYEPVVEPWQNFGWNDVPWMQSKQDEHFLNDVRPLRYRETPVYSEPGSPNLARAYFGKDDLCHDCLPPGSACEELCIVTKYEEGIKSGVSCSEDSYDEHEEASHSETIGQSPQTSPTSFLSSRLSDLSIKCRGELLSDAEAASLGGDLPRLLSPFEGCKCDKDPEAASWIENESSRCSSPVSCEEVCDALATPLSPAKANVIQVPRPVEYPFITPLRSEPLPPGYRRPAMPFRSMALLQKSVTSPSHALKLGDDHNQVLGLGEDHDQGREFVDKHDRDLGMEDNRDRRKGLDISIVHPLTEIAERKATTTPVIPFRRPARRTQGWLHMKRRNLKGHISTPINQASSFQEPTFTPPSSPSTCKPTQIKLLSRHTELQDNSLQLRKLAINANVEAIREAIRGFPLEMLSLENHCITVIRCKNQSFHRVPSPERLSSKSNSPSKSSSSGLQPRQSLRRRAQRSSLFAPILQNQSTKALFLERKDDDIFSPQTSQRSLTPSWIEPTASIHPPNLNSLQAIFPTTDDWWRGILYAHLVAYNYIRSLQKSADLSSRRVPFKAAMRLGIPPAEALQTLEYLQGAECPADTLADVIDGLTACISQIAACMDGTRPVSLGNIDAVGRRADPSFVRALAEVVNSCETREREQY